MALADIKISAGAIKITQADITDLRFNKKLCGLVHAPIEQIDSTVIFNQFQSWYKQQQDKYDKDIAMWTKEKKEAFDKWYIENTKAFINEFNTWYNTNTKQWEKDFTTWFKNTEVWEKQFTDWFATIKNALDGDIATKLTVKTIELEEKISTLSGASGEKEKLNKEDFNTFKTNEFNNFKKSTETQLAENAKQIEENNNNIKAKILSNMIRHSYSDTLVSSNWVDDTITSGYWYYIIADNKIKKNTIANFAIHLNDIDNATDFKMLNVTQTFDGSIRFYAKAKPTKNISVDIQYILQVGDA